MKVRKMIRVSTAFLIVFGVLGVSSGTISASQHPTQNATVVNQSRKPVQQTKPVQSNNDWFNDGLSKHELKARHWVSTHESGNHWNVLSYGHRCIGYFQLDPRYLGRKHGRINLDHKHQVKVADRYAKKRYGGWVHAKHFWQAHHWY